MNAVPDYSKHDIIDDDRWQTLYDATFAMDGASLRTHAEMLSAIETTFRGCDPVTDFEGRAVHYLVSVMKGWFATAIAA